MPNIGTRQTAAELLEAGAQRGAYGDHLTFEKDDCGCIYLHTSDGKRIAHGRVDGAAVDLEHLTELDETERKLVIPYVNAFIAHSNQKVEKNWRTKEYQLIRTSRDLEPKPLEHEHGPSVITQVVSDKRRSIAIMILEVDDGPDRLRSLADAMTQALEALEAG